MFFADKRLASNRKPGQVIVPIMGKEFHLKLGGFDLGQILDGLRCRQESWANTAIFLRDDYTCQYCGMHSRDLTLDHVMPKHHGGGHSWDNLVSACRSCNHRKGGRTLSELPGYQRVITACVWMVSATRRP